MALPIGTVSDLVSGGNDLLEVTTSDGRKLLIPFVEAIVPEVHLGGRLAAANPASWACWSSEPGRLTQGHRQKHT